ncbi:amidoligase family protein [Novipirellula aureliae]|uniref:amidoligase family protein n=1 Tax=Novipirellula aureliae TaxID=2527966 RepID=UPI0011B63D53
MESPVLRGYEGLQNVERAVDAIKARGAGVNEGCGLHITITWNGDAAALARLISLIGNHERAIYASTGTKRRERNTWAKQIKSFGNKDAAKRNCEADQLAFNTRDLAIFPFANRPSINPVISLSVARFKGILDL